MRCVLENLEGVMIREVTLVGLLIIGKVSGEGYYVIVFTKTVKLFK